MSFAELKRNRKTMISKLVTEADKVKGGKKSYGDDNVWKPSVDKAGNGYAVIRFLPSADDEKTPWTQYWDHGFQGSNGRWYIERSLTSIGQPDPVSEYNSILWNSGHDEDKETARNQKRRLHYVSNIYVISDPAHPENEGKVFKYQYGKKIFNKITDMMEPIQIEGLPIEEQDQPVNPFDMWGGADFKLKIRNVENYRNYDKSEFAKPSALKDNDKDLEAIFDSMHDLGEYTDPAQYKSYAALQKKMQDVLGDDLPEKLRIQLSEDATAESVIDSPAPKAAPIAGESKEAAVDSNDEDEMAGFFEKLAAED